MTKLSTLKNNIMVVLLTGFTFAVSLLLAAIMLSFVYLGSHFAILALIGGCVVFVPMMFTILDTSCDNKGNLYFLGQYIILAD